MKSLNLETTPRSNKMKQVWPFATLLGVMIVVELLYRCADATACVLRTPIWNITFNILDPIYLLASFALIPAFAAIFVSRNVFRTWLKFSLWALLISLALTQLPIGGSPGSYFDMFTFSPDDIAQFVGKLFVIFSLAIIIWQEVKIGHFASRTK